MVDESGATVSPDVGLRVLENAKEAVYKAFEGQGDSPASAVSTAIVGYRNAMRWITDLEDQKDAAYEERNRLVAALTKRFPAYLARHPEYDESWEDDWRWIVFVDLPTGQVSWHIHDSERHRFAHLRVDANRWDGHTTEEKYQRLEALPVRTATR